MSDAQADVLINDIALIDTAPVPPGGRPRGEALVPTRRERKVLALLARGLTRREVADQLGVGADTVKTELEHARGRLGARNVTHAVALAVARGDVNVDDVGAC